MFAYMQIDVHTHTHAHTNTGVVINMAAFGWASLANLAAALKGKFGKEVTHKLKDNHATNNMDSANSYAVMNIISVYVCVCVCVCVY